MVGQLERSAARKRLTDLCSKAIKDFISIHTTPKTSEKKMLKNYLSATKIALGNALEAMICKPVPPHLAKKGDLLSFFAGVTEEIGKMRDVNSVIEIRDYVANNLGILSEEDLGGVSELFSGHIAVWKNGNVELTHNPARRDAGKIYTPYDVTDYMCNAVARKIISECNSTSQLYQKRILDPAIGSGAFCSQLVRKLWDVSRENWKLTDEVDFKTKICNNVIHGVDIDREALELAKVVLWVSAGTPDFGLRLNLSHCDSLKAGPCKKKSNWEKATKLKLGLGYDAVIGNPPYVAVNENKIKKFQTKSAKNLYCAFTELGTNLVNQTGILCFIIPQSFVGGKQFAPLRNYVLGLDASVSLNVFDSVPDFLFDQGKIETNSNTNINQRTAIITINNAEERSLSTSPLLRWRRPSERDLLFDNLRSVRITHEDILEGRIPMINDVDELAMLRRIRLVKRRITDATTLRNSKSLYITKAVRYFITALPKSLGRDNTMKIDVCESEFARVHVLLNSNFFYWWWRLFGNGFQLESKDVETFPLVPLDSEFCNKLSKELIKAEKECTVFKRNSGKDVPNVNYNFKQQIVKEIDNKIATCLGVDLHRRIFSCKSNSLFWHMDELIGYDENEFLGRAMMEINIENKSLKPNKKQLLMSSIAAWKIENLPKFLIVWETDTEMARIEGRNGRHISGKLVDFHIYYIREEINVPWEDNPLPHNELTNKKWSKELDIQLKAEVERLHKEYPDRLIKFQKSFKNETNVRLQYSVKDHKLLPQVPENIKQERAFKSLLSTCKKIVGTVVKVKKFDQPFLQGKRVWLTEKILQMEHKNKQQLQDSGMHKGKASKKSKDVGELYLITPDGKHPDGINLSKTIYGEKFSAREDYWVGNAIDVVMDYMNEELKQTRAKEIGVDLKLKSWIDEIPNSKNELVRATKKFKHEILKKIQESLGIEPQDSDTSSGSTVTRSALIPITKEIYRLKNLNDPLIKSKRSCIESSLKALDEEFEEGDVSGGGTITAYSLFKIFRGLSKV